ncbi:MAG: hypothetical protein ACI9AV_001434, partial [Sediminicola sp.]
KRATSTPLSLGESNWIILYPLFCKLGWATRSSRTCLFSIYQRPIISGELAVTSLPISDRTFEIFSIF